ncbi:mechanosensitive ion channel family protein, partial [Klebsiella quasipneumoniae]
VLSRAITRISKRTRTSKRSADEVKRIETSLRLIRFVSRLVVWALAVTISLSILGISVAPILTTAGVSGIAVGFAAQSLIKDYFSGLVLLLEGQLRIGDIVDIGGVAGQVEEMTLRYVRLRQLNGDVVYVPNGAITNLTNKTTDYSMAVIDVGVAYRENLQEALNVMESVARELASETTWSTRILAEPEVFGVETLGDSSVILRLRLKVLPGEQWSIRREYLHRIKQRFDELGIEIPYPHLTLYAGQDKDGKAPAFRIEAPAGAQ